MVIRGGRGRRLAHGVSGRNWDSVALSSPGVSGELPDPRESEQALPSHPLPALCQTGARPPKEDPPPATPESGRPPSRQLEENRMPCSAKRTPA